MNSSNKLDFLQELAWMHIGDSRKLYLAGLLAEHAEEDEMTADFLDWVRTLLEG